MKKFILTIGAAAVLGANSLLVSAGPVNFTTLGNIAPGNLVNASDVATAFNEVQAAMGDCPADMVKVGPICADKYEASVWNAATGGTQITDIPMACGPNGNNCSASDPAGAPSATAIYARSVEGVPPAVNITWYQARQACANVGKRLLTNAEWQMAAAGTDDAVCTTAGGVQATGAMAACLSNWGANDMAGNASEWVADWLQGDTTPYATVVAGLGVDFGDDIAGGTNPATKPVGNLGLPSALHRGGSAGAGAGVFAVNADAAPSFAQADIGFRCGRSL